MRFASLQSIIQVSIRLRLKLTREDLDLKEVVLVQAPFSALYYLFYKQTQSRLSKVSCSCTDEISHHVAPVTSIPWVYVIEGQSFCGPGTSRSACRVLFTSHTEANAISHGPGIVHHTTTMNA